MSDIVARYLALTGDPRRVVASPEARYFGYLLGDDTLVPGRGARIAHTGLEEWYRRTAARTIAAQ